MSSKGSSDSEEQHDTGELSGTVVDAGDRQLVVVDVGVGGDFWKASLQLGCRTFPSREDPIFLNKLLRGMPD